MHELDHILEKFILNDRSLSSKERSRIHNHLKSCTQCQSMLNYYSSIWHQPINLNCKVVDTPINELIPSPMVLAAATLKTAYSEITHLSNCYSQDHSWSVQFFRNNTDQSVLFYLVSNDPVGDVPLLVRIRGIEKVIVVDASRRISLPASTFPEDTDWDAIEIWIVKPLGQIEFEDVHMISKSGDNILLETNRNNAKFALQKTPRSGLKWIKLESPGTFSLNLNDWTPDTTVWYYE